MSNIKAFISSLLFLFLCISHAIAAPCKFEVILSGTDIRCFGESNGSATLSIVQVGGNSAPYSVRWFDDNNLITRNDLPAGTHFVEVTDDEGCQVIEFITLNQPDDLELSFIKIDVQCNGEPDGSIDLFVQGGTTPYFYTWANSSGTFNDNTEDIGNLLREDYTVEVRDFNNCIAQLTIDITEPDALGISPTIEPVTCAEGTDGQIRTVIFGGVLPYRYAWSNGDTIPTANFLSSGNVSLTITDGNNCTLTESYFMPEPPPLSISFQVTDLSCFDEPDGQIFCSASGGTPGYRWEWASSLVVLGDTTNNPTGLLSDYYKVTLTDANGCIKIDSVFVDQPNPMVLNLEPTAATCFNKADGSIDLSISGGREPYAILWDNGDRTEDVNTLLAREYTVVVADATGCSQLGTVIVDQPDSLNFNYIITAVSCKDQDDGMISIDPNGGTPAYFANWDNGSTSFELKDLDGGFYTIILTDQNSCSYNATFEMPINPEACVTSLTIPSAFTPNGDNVNDLWHITNYEVYPNMEVAVYDKWGKQVFRSIGYNEPWNGRINSTEGPTGIYYYIVNLNNGDPPFRGAVTIVR